MGKKSTPEMPERYELEEMLKYNTDLNRYDAINPFGSQKWSVGEDGRWTMTQAPSEKFSGLMDQQFDFVNRGPEYYGGSPGRDAAQQKLFENMMGKYGTSSGGPTPDVPSSTPSAPSSYSSAPPDMGIAPNRPEEPPMGPQQPSEGSMGPPSPSGGGINWRGGGEALAALSGNADISKIIAAMQQRGA